MEETKKQKSNTNPFKHNAEQAGQTEQPENIENGATSKEKEKAVSSREVLDEFLKQHKADSKKGILKEQIKETKEGDSKQELK